MKKYGLKKNKWTLRVLPLLLLSMGVLVALGFIFPSDAGFSCEEIDNIQRKDFGTLDPELSKAWNACIIKGYVPKP